MEAVVADDFNFIVVVSCFIIAEPHYKNMIEIFDNIK